LKRMAETFLSLTFSNTTQIQIGCVTASKQ
jgi:hypothetical protein